MYTLNPSAIRNAHQERGEAQTTAIAKLLGVTYSEALDIDPFTSEYDVLLEAATTEEIQYARAA